LITLLFFALLPERTMMSLMAKASEVRELDARGAEQRSRRKRERMPEANDAFARAFADALRDILRDERRRAAWY
jgi:hypothetical protein